MNQAKRTKFQHQENGEQVHAEATQIPIDIPTDTEFCFLAIKQLIPQNWPQLVFQSQIYGMISDRTLVEQDLQLLRKSLQFTFLSYNSSSGSSLSAIIDNKDYSEDISKHIISQCSMLSTLEQSILTKKFTSFVNSNVKYNVNRQDFLDFTNEDVGSMKEKDVELLIQIGFVSVRNDTEITSSSTDQMLRLTHPLLGATMNFMKAAEKTILQWINRSRYKEIPEKLITVDKSTSSKTKMYILKGTPFSVKYHLLDMMGQGLVAKIYRPATQDYIIRLGKGL